ncbi:hypothetical protein FQV27_15820 [Paracoccus aurantiacus]|uniref:Uncharacterized protein n=1 Tax=Paracoccus aurantiacus TaxID=2599412 RepID=A0A5C6RX39_9RHOB|nr:hypothetical protein [Paracoccus aurantiacus]TXB66379.1 hypothetical protein FQV27_15820 [Paracoccus aurantiacus]
MTKSPTDHEHRSGSGRVRAYTTQERESGLHPAVEALHRRPHSRDGDEGRKASEYARIERGREE